MDGFYKGGENWDFSCFVHVHMEGCFFYFLKKRLLYHMDGPPLEKCNSKHIHRFLNGSRINVILFFFAKEKKKAPSPQAC